MKDYREILKSAGLKVTPQRLNVLMSFDMINKHPTTDEIIEGVHKIAPILLSVPFTIFWRAL